MSYRDNFWRHMKAGIPVAGFDDRLARDFWTGSEDLWDPTSRIRNRWLKLCFVYFVCVLAQITLPLSLVGLVIVPLRHGEWFWYWIALGVATGFGTVAALLHATRIHAAILRESDRRYSIPTPPSARERLSGVLWIVFVAVPVLVATLLFLSRSFPR